MPRVIGAQPSMPGPHGRPAHSVFSAVGSVGRALAEAAVGLRTGPDTASAPTIETICADLHRLDVEIADLLRASRLPGHYQRLTAAELAYEYVLRDACRAVEVEAPPIRERLTGLARLQLEAELHARGLRW